MTRKKRRTKSKAKPLLLLLLVIILLVIGVYSGLKNFNKPYDANTTDGLHIEIASGMGTATIGEVLEDNGIIKDALIFKLKSRLKGYDGKYQAGTFVLSPAMSMDEIMIALMEGKKETVRFTIPEGYTIQQTAKKLSNEGFIDEEAFKYQLKNGDFSYQFLAGVGEGDDRLEGFLFPDTYEIFKDATEKDIINKMLSGFDAVFTDAHYRKAKEMGLSVKEVVTIASLIEEETKIDDERTLVSSVIYNRLDINMKLRFCSTVLYALGEQKPRLLYSDLEIDSPYNTYQNEGLPPGPISSPGKACINAALYPANTDYLFFVLKNDGSGAHNFAENESAFFNYKEDYLNTLQ